MRVITGSKRGRKLRTLEGLDVRPTTDKVKEAMFSAVQFAVPGAIVLDLFAGSGQLGIEALSRGASKCLFIEQSAKAAEVVADNIGVCGFGDRSSLRRTDAVSFLKTCPYRFDIAFLDPPYDSNLLSQTLPLLEPLLTEGAIVIAEHDRNFIPEDQYGSRLKLTKQYRYGIVNVSKFEITDSIEAKDI
jgi:16S rRNA (guanine(966)-N(2))-methyltransferase RsmD